MGWDNIIFDTAQPGKNLPRQIELLLQQQRETWEMLREGEASLFSLTTKVFSRDNSHIFIQSNPGRKISVNAKVDPASIAKRPCFLCVENIPAEERGISCDEFVILPNPYPILRNHLTIPIREHEPQKLAGRIESKLKLARQLGPDMLVFYNGARCGASAPDHFHFQACDASKVPLLADLSFVGTENRILPYISFGRNMLVCQNQNAEKVALFIECALNVLSSFMGEKDEPLINIISIFRDGRYLTVLFPRAKHRPACFFADGETRLSISPAALEMAGILVVSDPDHFDRVDEGTALSIYEEVSLDKALFTKLVEAVA